MQGVRARASCNLMNPKRQRRANNNARGSPKISLHAHGSRGQVTALSHGVGWQLRNEEWFVLTVSGNCGNT